MGPRRAFKFSRSAKKKGKCTHASATTDGTGTDGSSKKCCGAGAATPNGSAPITPAQQTARSLMECPVSASCCTLHCNGCCTSCNIPSRAQRKAAARCAAYSANISGYQLRRRQLAEAAQIKSQNINLRIPGAGNTFKKAASRNPAPPPTPTPAECSASQPSSAGSESSFSSLYEPRGYFGLDSPAVHCTDCLKLGTETVDDEYSEDKSEVKSCEEVYNDIMVSLQSLRKKVVLIEKMPYMEVLKLLDAEIKANEEQSSLKDEKGCEYDDEAYSIENSDDDYEDSSPEAQAVLDELMKGISLPRKRKGYPRRSMGAGCGGRKFSRSCNKRMKKVVGKIKIEMDVIVEPKQEQVVKEGAKANVCEKKCCTGMLPSFMCSGNPKDKAREFKNLTIVEQQQYLAHALCYLANNLNEDTGRPEPSLENCTALQLLSVYFDYEDDHRDQTKYEFISFANEFIRCYLMESMKICVKTEKGDQYLDTLLGHLNDIIVKVDRTFVKLIEQEDIKIEEDDLMLLRRLFAYAFACGKDLESIKDLVRDNDTAADFYKEICRMLPIDFESFKAEVDGGAKNPLSSVLGCSKQEVGKEGSKADESVNPEDVEQTEVCFSKQFFTYEKFEKR